MVDAQPGPRTCRASNRALLSSFRIQKAQRSGDGVALLESRGPLGCLGFGLAVRADRTGWARGSASLPWVETMPSGDEPLVDEFRWLPIASRVHPSGAGV